ncbi:MAG: bifunctional oligoribonuclease/PAP phosphatase NrnA [bacterium]
MNPIIQTLKQYQNFLITSHVNPDGDSLGSEIALAMALKKMNKEVVVLGKEGIPGLYKFLPGVDLIKNQEYISDYKSYVAIILDCGDIKRIQADIDKVRDSILIINIDHHFSNNYYGDQNLVCPEASATAEIIYELIEEVNSKLFDKDIATNLYVGIFTDTGSFRYANTTPKSLFITSKLLAYDVKPDIVATQIHETVSYGRLKLLGKALHNLEVSSDGRKAWMVINKKMAQQTNHSLLDTEEFVNYPRSIRGIEVAILFREEVKGYKVSLRSKGKLNVANVALKFNGGGHNNAAGCTIEADLEKVKTDIFKALDEEGMK